MWFTWTSTSILRYWEFCSHSYNPFSQILNHPKRPLHYVSWSFCLFQILALLENTCVFFTYPGNELWPLPLDWKINFKQYKGVTYLAKLAIMSGHSHMANQTDCHIHNATHLAVRNIAGRAPAMVSVTTHVASFRTRGPSNIHLDSDSDTFICREIQKRKGKKAG